MWGIRHEVEQMKYFKGDVISRSNSRIDGYAIFSDRRKLGVTCWAESRIHVLY